MCVCVCVYEFKYILGFVCYLFSLLGLKGDMNKICGSIVWLGGFGCDLPPKLKIMDFLRGRLPLSFSQQGMS